MAYADSAIDYKWEVHNISLDQNLMTVKYEPADSTDSARPAIFRNIPLNNDQFNDSDIRQKAEDASTGAVAKWDQIIEANAAHPGFNADSYIGVSNSARYVPTRTGAIPTFNSLTHKIVEGLTADSYQRTVTFTATPLSGAEKASVHAGMQLHIGDLWRALESDGRLDSAVSLFGADSLQNHTEAEVQFKYGEYEDNRFRFSSLVSTKIRTLLGYTSDSAGDSDYAAFLRYVDNSQRIV